MGRDRIGALAPLAAALLLLLALAAALHNIELQPGRPLPLELFQGEPAAPGGPATLELPRWLPAALAIGTLAGLIGLFISPSLRRDLRRTLPLYLLLALGIYLIGSSLRRGSLGPGIRPDAPKPAGEPPPPISLPDAPSAPPAPPEWLVSALTVALIVALVAGALLLLRRSLRRAPAPIDQIVEEAREALADLRAGADLRSTIARCYAEMVRLLSERRGVAREASLTPREFEQRLAALGVGDRHIQRLTRLFEQLRYSPHPPGPAEEREAEECLEAIVALGEAPRRAGAR